MDGIALDNKLKSEHPLTKVVLVSGHHSVIDEISCDGVFQKPYDNQTNREAH